MITPKDTHYDAVVTIDIQKDYFFGGAFPLWKAQKALKNTRRILNQARKFGIPVLHIQHIGLSPDAKFLKSGTPGTDLHPGLDIPKDGSETLVIKHFPDSFLGTDLHEKLQSMGAKRILWMGMITWMCVDTTVRSAKALGYENTLVEDACASGWMLKNRLPVFPWTSQRAFLAALGYHHARVMKTSLVQKELQ